MIEAGFKASVQDPGLFIGHFEMGLVFVAVYVDDIVIATVIEEYRTYVNGRVNVKIQG